MYCNDSVFQKIAAVLVSHRLKRSAKLDRLKALAQKYKDVIDKQRRRSAARTKSEGIEEDFTFFSQLHRASGTTAVVNPPAFLEIGIDRMPN